MSVAPAAQTETGSRPPGPTGGLAGRGKAIKALVGVGGLIVVIAVVGTLFQALSLYDVPKLLSALLATLGGVLGAMGLFYFLNMLVESLPQRLSLGTIPYAFLLPAFGLLGAFLIFPTIQTVIFSFANDTSTEWVGFSNYREVLSDAGFLNAITNTLLWLIIVPTASVAIGLVVAVLADKLGATSEKIAKSVIFLPMAISMVGAATIWRFVYAFAPEGRTQIGLLNALWTTLGFDPVSWVQVSGFNLNDVLMMVILIWLQVGFSMVLLSAAIKSVPDETLEAARIDGATELQIFWQVVVPQIRGTMITVFITVLILVLKVFDIVYVMTAGNFDTNVISVLFVQQLFQFGEYGIASAIVVLLLLAVMPVVWYQIRHIRSEEAT